MTRNQNQYGFFGVALALVTWFSGAAICISLAHDAGLCSQRTVGESARSSEAGGRSS